MDWFWFVRLEVILVWYIVGFEVVCGSVGLVVVGVRFFCAFVGFEGFGCAYDSLSLCWFCLGF